MIEILKPKKVKNFEVRLSGISIKSNALFLKESKEKTTKPHTSHEIYDHLH